jgi:hypothetical protein
MKKRTRLAALALAVCLALSLLVLPAAAASAGTFADVTDSQLAGDIESLRLLGVLDGYADGSFRPANPLTRAQFCKMAVYAVNGGSQVGQYQTYTIFPDVKPSYWAAGYINMASKGKSIILGYPDGRFYPGRTVTAAQAVTILMRLLGYADADVGAVWPDGYLATARTVGLTDGLNLTPSAPLTRAQAAHLFANLLACNTKDKGAYAATISSEQVSDAVVLSSSARAADGTAGAMQLSNGKIYRMANKTSNGLLNGRKGTALLDKEGRVLTFVPSADGSYRTVTVSQAKSGSLTDTSGSKYTLTAETTAYSEGKETKWGEVFSWLTSGTAVTLYFDASGSVAYVFVGGGGTAVTEAVVVGADGSSAGLTALAGSSSYAIYKNGLRADASDLRKYDVATYSGATGSVRVSDTRLSGFYEDCYPNTEAPTKVTVMGREFTVLAGAMASLSSFKLGDQITLLLTEDRQVAGAVPRGTLQENAVGLVTALSAESATVELLSGLKVTGSVSISASQVTSLSGQLVTVTAPKRGTLSLTRLSGSNSLSLNVATRKLGTDSLAENARLYEKAGSSALVAIDYSRLTMSSVPASGIAYAHRNWRGDADILVFSDVTGDAYTYGRIQYTSRHQVTDSEGLEPGAEGYTPTYSKPSLSLLSGDKTIGPFAVGYEQGRTGDYAGMAVSADGGSLYAVVKLTRLSGVANSAWLDQTAVTVSGTTYTVPDSVLCYNECSEKWITLSAAHAFAAKADLYADSHGNIRVVVVA